MTRRPYTKKDAERDRRVIASYGRTLAHAAPGCMRPWHFRDLKRAQERLNQYQESGLVDDEEAKTAVGAAALAPDEG
jgi:hypothetical protein